MIRLTRSAQLASRGAGRWYSGWNAPHTRVYVVRARGLRVDSALFGAHGPRKPRAGQLNIQLDGSLVARRASHEQTIDSRSIALDPSLSWDERWLGPSFRVLMVEWDAGFGPTPSAFEHSTLSILDHERLATIADVIEQESDVARTTVAIDSLYEILSANGLRIDGLTSLTRGAEDARHVATARLLSALRSSLETQPAWIDAVRASERSERQLRRDIASLLSRLHLDLQGLREILVRERVLSAAQLLSAKGASVTEVARSVGFGTARALGLALERAGLPTATTLASYGRDD